jgi:hypothetical protein
VEFLTHSVNWWQRVKDQRSGRIYGAISDWPKEPPTEHELERRRLASQQRSVRRAKQRVRWLIAATGADHMLTLTYRENMQDVERLKADWKAFVRLVSKELPEWPYVAVKERQDRGAYHLHVALKGRQDIGLLRRCWYQVVGEGNGQIDVQGPKRRWGSGGAVWSSRRIASYLTKYLAKDLGDEVRAEEKKYWARKGVQIPEKRIWIGATNFLEAVEETYRLVAQHGCRQTDLWYSEDGLSIWVDGS